MGLTHSTLVNAGATWAVVLVKDFDLAKTRLSPEVTPPGRRRLAMDCARLAIVAARASMPVLCVAGSAEVAALAESEGAAHVILERDPAGQNPAARAGIAAATSGGAGAVMLISSDLPLVTPAAVADFLAAASALPGASVMAAPATGRGGTNALYLRPPTVIDLHFGDDSLAKFEAAARAAGVVFANHASRELSLDLDTPEDLRHLEAAG